MTSKKILIIVWKTVSVKGESMKNKGFTLVELVAVIAILGIIALIATPNILKLISDGKKEQFVTDAKEMISKTKYYFKQERYSSLFTNEDGCKVITATKVGFEKKENADGDLYDLTNSKVKVCLSGDTYIYYVVTISSKKDSTKGRGIFDKNTVGGYVKEKNLSIDYVH